MLGEQVINVYPTDRGLDVIVGLSLTIYPFWLGQATGTPSHGATVNCAFNPCGVPGFCGRGRTCEMDSNCIHRCVCEENSDHWKCKETDDINVTPQPIKCTFNPCSSPAFSCSGGRKCGLGKFCMPQCQCTGDSTHPSCAEENDGVAKSTLEPTTSHRESVCSDDNPCIHGKCMLSKTCVCDIGWEGSLCNVSLCTKPCDANRGLYCHYVSPSLQICVNNHNKQVTPVTTSKQPILYSFDTCHMNYKQRPLKERTCPTGVICQYGYCSKDGDEEL
ncbi:hypothetical protein DPMN_083636, partial [Dreissena polymorpha]